VRLSTTELKFIKQSWDKSDLNEFFAMKVLTPTADGKTKPTIKTKAGLREPNTYNKQQIDVVKLTATTTYLDLYKAQYAYYKKNTLFPRQSLQRDPLLSGNAGQCLAFCHDGFASVSGVCQPCVLPCATCRHEVQRCLTCDQSQPQKYRFGRSCYRECPRGTIADESDPKDKKCLNCESGCVTCSKQDQSKCLKCETNPLLFLHNEKCVAQCPPKWRPALFENECVEETEVPVIYFPLMIMTLLMAIIAYAGQYSSKLLDQRNHRKLISFNALTGVIDVLAMYFQVFCTIF